MSSSQKCKGSIEYHILLDQIIDDLVDQSKQAIDLDQKIKLLYLVGDLVKIRI